MQAVSDPIITITDVCRAGYCPSGARAWFRAYGLDFTAFLRDGIPASTALATGDALAGRIIAGMGKE